MINVGARLLTWANDRRGSNRLSSTRERELLYELYRSDPQATGASVWECPAAVHTNPYSAPLNHGGSWSGTCTALCWNIASYRQARTSTAHSLKRWQRTWMRVGKWRFSVQATPARSAVGATNVG